MNVTHTGPQAQEAAEKALAMALQHIRICAPDPTVEAALEAIDLKALAPPARVVSDDSEPASVVEALTIFTRCAYPCDKSIDPRGYSWCEAYLDQALTTGQAALSTLQSGAEGKDGACVWVQDTDTSSWDTACGNKHQFTEGDAADNLHVFCPYCGNHLVEPNYDTALQPGQGEGS